MPMGQLPGALILGIEHQGLGLLRQLCSSGVRCVLVDQDHFGLARLSRYRAKFHHSPAYASEEFWPWLRKLANDYGYKEWVVYPTDDEQVRQLALHHDELLKTLRYAGPSWDVYSKLFNKRATHQWATDLGINPPRSFIPVSKKNLDGCNLSFPFIVKPAVKTNFYNFTNKKAIAVKSAVDLKRVLSKELDKVPIEELMFQEIPGGGEQQWSYAGFFVKGEAIAAFTACRRRQHPPDFGRASTFVAAVYDEEVEKEGKKIIGDLGYTGLAEVEWKRDPRSGQLKFLEVNSRCWGWQSLSSKVVGNLAKLLYDYVVVPGNISKREAKYGLSWIKWSTDIPTALHLIVQGNLSLKDYLKSVSKDTVWCEGDRADPWPLFLQIFLLPYLMKKRGY